MAPLGFSADSKAMSPSLGPALIVRTAMGTAHLVSNAQGDFPCQPGLASAHWTKICRGEASLGKGFLALLSLSQPLLQAVTVTAKARLQLEMWATHAL